jgi:hypothetical protein
MSPYTYIKTEDLPMLFKQLTQSLAKALALQGGKSMHTLTPTQVTAAGKVLVCIFCSQSGYFIAQCLVFQDYITVKESRGKDCPSQ